MAVRINNGRLDFTSNLDPTGFRAGEKKMEQAIDDLKSKLATYQAIADKTLNGNTLEKYNKKIQETQKELERLRNVGKQGFDELGNKITQNSSFLDRLKGGLVTVGSTLLAAFSVQAIIQFGRELFQLEAKVTGIERAFSRLGDTQLLAKLRQETKGFIADLDLERLTVKANNFNIPIAKLGTFLLFASQRAKDTGEDVDKLTNNIIDGLGRKSARIIDNLGISLIEVQAEFKKTGDFTQAVSNIIEREMGLAGTQVDTLADKVNRTSTRWENFKKIVASTFDALTNNDRADNVAITDLTERNLKKLGDLNKLDSVQRADAINKTAIAIRNLSKEYDQILKDLDGAPFNGKNINDLNFLKKNTGENLAAQQNVLKVLNKQNEALNKQYRYSIDLVSLDEKRQQVTDLTEQAGNIIPVTPADVAKVKSLLQDAKDIQEEIDAITGKQEKKDAKDLDREQAKIRQILAARQTLQDRLNQLDDQYTRKSLNKDQEEVQALRDKFKVIANEYKKFNDDPENRKRGITIDTSKINTVRDKAISDLTLEQSLNIEKKNIEEQKQIYKDYEDYKAQVGEKAADERFGSEIGKYKTFIDYLKGLVPKDVAGFEKLNEYVENTALPAAQLESIERQKKQLTQLLKNNVDYETERKLLIQKSEDDIALLRKNGYDSQADQVKANLNVQLSNLDEENIKKKKSYRDLFDGIENLSEEAARKNLKTLKTYVDSAYAAGLITKDVFKSVSKLIHDTTAALDEKNAQKIIDLGSAFESVGASISNVSAGLGGLVTGLGQIVSGYGNIKKLSGELKNATTNEEKFQANANLVVAGIGAITDIVGIFTSSAKARKEAEEAYYNSVIASQNQYNLSLNEQIRLRYQLNENLFTKDYKSQILDGTKALVDANDKFNQSLIDLQKGQAKIGQRDKVDANAILKGVGAGATLGAAVGSIVPVIGTAIGAVVGGIVGGIAGLFGGKKKADVFGGLLTEYPELIYKATDGTDKFNDALAESLIQNNLVNDSTKALLQNTIELNKARQAAIDQINSAISELAGSLGDDLRNSLVQAFKDGSDAAQAFGDDVSKVIENIVSQFLFDEIFGSQFDELQKQLKASFDVGGDNSLTDDIIRFYQAASPLIDQFNAGLQAAEDIGKQYDLNIFTPTTGSAKGQNSLSGSIKANLTEDTGTVLAGTLRGIQLGVNETNLILKSQNLSYGQMMLIAQETLDVAIQIEINTKRTADNTDSLPEMLSELKDINTTSSSSLDILARSAGI